MPRELFSPIRSRRSFEEVLDQVAALHAEETDFAAMAGVIAPHEQARDPFDHERVWEEQTGLPLRSASRVQTASEPSTRRA